MAHCGDVVQSLGELIYFSVTIEVKKVVIVGSPLKRKKQHPRWMSRFQGQIRRHRSIDKGP